MLFRSPAPIRLHYITWLTKNAQPKRRVFPHAAACASLPIPTMSNNTPSFPSVSALQQRRISSAEAVSIPASSSCQHAFSVSFAVIFSTVWRRKEEDRGSLPGPGQPRQRVVDERNMTVPTPAVYPIVMVPGADLRCMQRGLTLLEPPTHAR